MVGFMRPKGEAIWIASALGGAVGSNPTACTISGVAIIASIDEPRSLSRRAASSALPGPSRPASLSAFSRIISLPRGGVPGLALATPSK